MTEALAMNLGWMLVCAFWSLVCLLVGAFATYAIMAAKKWIRTRWWWK